jgi:RNA polymerase-binding transcription factor DksA
MDLGTQTHLDTLRDLLTTRLRELQASAQAIGFDRGSHAEAGHEVSDLKDQAAQAVSAEIDDADQQRHVLELADVRLALERLAHGSYGDCIACGETIPLQRLLVQPAAARCTACQALVEKAG